MISVISLFYLIITEMKKYLLIIVAIIATSFASFAQKPELYVGYGGYTQMDATNMHDDWNSVNNAWGAVTVGVNFKVAPKFWIGPSYTISSTTTKGPESSSILYNAVMLNGRYQYWSNRVVKLYGQLGLGVEISHMMPKHFDSYNKTYFAYQISPLGAEAQIANNVSLYGELGFGAQGLLQVGVRFGL